MSGCIECAIPKPLRVLVFCVQPGTLLNYSALLNERGVFHLNLCATVQEVARALARVGHVDWLVHDDFRFDAKDRDFVLEFARHSSVDSLLVVGDMRFGQRRKVFDWAREHEVPLVHFFQQPMCSKALEKVLTHYRQRCGPVCQGLNAGQAAIENSNSREIRREQTASTGT